MTSDLPVLYHETGTIAWITLNAPERKNSLTQEAIELLSAAWAAFETGPARVAILAGAGGSFCAGLDLETLPDPAPAVPGIGALVTKPVVAAVSGPAIGLGLTLTMQADLAVADNTAFFQYPEGRVGFTGGLIAGLGARMPAKIVNEIVLLGSQISADKAAQTGLINEVVTAASLSGRAEEMAQVIASSAPLVVQAMKEELGATLPKSPAELSGLFRARMARIQHSADRQEGLDAFKEKRRPKFSGR